MRFLRTRETHAKRVLRSKEDEDDEDDEDDSEDPPNDAYFDLPAEPGLPRLPTDAGWDIHDDNTWTLDQSVRGRLLSWLAGIDRSSLGSVVSQTLGFGARYTSDTFKDEDDELAACYDAEEAAASAAEGLGYNEGSSTWKAFMKDQMGRFWANDGSDFKTIDADSFQKCLASYQW
jgi:hypothetical protein